MAYKTAKGVRQDDGTYIYSCAGCSGTWNPKCNYCKGRDMDAMIEAFTVARGQQYYSLWKAILTVIGKAICDEIRDIEQETGKITPADLVYLCIKFRLPPNRFKPMVEWLEENRIIPTGTYDDMKERGFKPTLAWPKVAAGHPRLQGVQ